MNHQENENEGEESLIEEEYSFDPKYYEELLQQMKKTHEVIKTQKEEFDQYEQIIQKKIEENEELVERNINLKQETMYELECRQNVVKSLSQTQGVFKDFVEKKNTVQNLVEIYESDVVRSEQLNQQITADFEKLLDINKEKSKKYVDKYKEVNQNHQKLKKIIAEMIDYFANTRKKATDGIDAIKNRLINLNEKHNFSKREHELIQKQTMDINSENREIFNKIEETKLAFDNFMQEKAQKTTEFEKKNAGLKEVSCNQKIELKKTVTELESLQGAIRNQKELQNHIRTQNEELKNNSSQNKNTNNALNREIEKMKEIYEKETEESEKNEEHIKSQTEEINTKILKMEEENKQLEKNNFSLNTEINTISANITEQKLNYISLQHEENDLKVAQKNENNKLEEMVNALQLCVEMENKKYLELKTAEELLRNDGSQLDESLASYKNQYEKLCTEANENETEINLNIDALNESKSVVQSKLQESCKKLEDLENSWAEILKKEEENNEREVQKIIEHSNFFKNETERIRKLNDQQHKEKISKLKSSNTALQLQILEMQTQKENMRRNLDMRVKELNEMRAKIEEINKPEIEQQKEKAVTFKKPMYEDIELPELKVPPSKYSSTSFSDSSFSSVENDSRLKKRRQLLMKQRNKAKKVGSIPSKSIQKSSITSSQKELDDLFNSLRE